LPARKRRKPFFSRGAFWFIVILAVGALLGWRIWTGYYRVHPEFRSLLISLNSQPHLLLPGERFKFRPNDKVKILEISTNVFLNLGVRLVAERMDVNALRYEEMDMASLFQSKQLFEQPDVRVHVKHHNEVMGYVDWLIRPSDEDWLEKAERIIDPGLKVEFLEQAAGRLPENRTVRRHLIDAYKGAGQWGKAAKVLEDMVGKPPAADTLKELLDIYRSSGDRAKMASILEQLTRAEPDNLGLKVQLAELLDQTGKRSEAASVWESIVGQLEEKDRVSVYKHLGNFFAEAGQTNGAIQAYLGAERLDKQDANLYYNLYTLHEKIGQTKKALGFLESAIRLSPDDLDGRIKLAEESVKRGDYAKAESRLAEILNRDPKSIQALLLWMQVAEKQKDSVKLRKLYRQILALEPENDNVIYNLGALEYEAGNWKESLSYFKRYGAKHPQDADTHATLLDLYRKVGDQEAAFKQAQALVRLRPKALDAYSYMLESLERQKKYKEMIPLAEQGLKEVPGTVPFMEYLLLANLETGNKAGALGQLREILKLRPKDSALWLQQARLSEKLGRNQEAMEAYRRVMELSPGLQEAEEAYLRLRLMGVERGTGR
jgi:tetratricopeptide (TPR) repeat protein